MNCRRLLVVLKKGNSKRHFHKLTPEQLLIQNTCRNFAKTHLKPIASQIDRNQSFPEEQIKKLGELGLLSVCASTEWGGSGQDMLSLSLAVEELSKACASTGAIVSIHNCLYINLLDRLGTEFQKEKFLKPFTKGTLGCFALSEPGAGSDVSSISTTAKEESDGFILNGTKSWVTSGCEGKAAVIFATIDKNLKHKGITAFLVPMESPGLSLGKKEDKLGIRGTSTCNIILENVKVPRDYIVGSIGEGFKIAMSQLDRARVGIASQALGIGQAALEAALEYAAQRKQFGKKLNKMDGVRVRIADMAIKLESARLLVHRAAILCNEKSRSSKESSIAKIVASEAATAVSHSALQIFGGMGFVKDMSVERFYRDARITEIYGGVSDIQRMVIGKAVIKEFEGNKY